MGRTMRLPIFIVFSLCFSLSPIAYANNDVAEAETSGRIAQAILRAPASLVVAVLFVERHTQGWAFEAEGHVLNSKVIYRIKTFNNGAFVETDVDTIFAGILDVRRITGQPDDDECGENKDYSKLKELNFSLVAAIRRAEQLTG